MNKNRHGPCSNRPYDQKYQHNVKLQKCKCKITTLIHVLRVHEKTWPCLGESGKCGPLEAGEIP